MKIAEIKTKNEVDLKKLLIEKREALRSTRFGTSGSKSKNVKETNAIKKDIARILTESNSRKK